MSEDRKKTIDEALSVANEMKSKYNLNIKETNAIRILEIAANYLLASIDIMKKDKVEKIFN